MNLIAQICAILLCMNTTLFNFSTSSNIDTWQVVNDGVMGGLSQGQFSLNESGHGYFRGKVSLANKGGFSSVRNRFKTIGVKSFSKVKIRLKGDGKAYQFRVKATADQRYSYIGGFATSGDWEIVTIAFSHMYPAFRGRLLDMANYSGETMTEIAFLIGNKKEETFALEIDYIQLQ